VVSRYTNLEAQERSGERIGFSFGENWRKYLEGLDESKIEQATRSLEESFAGAPIVGERFVDIGCGSGLFSLCAFRLGAAEILSVDVDPNSAACAEYVRRLAGSPSHWSVRTGSILDDAFVSSLGAATRVYSWGVLHHSGATWRATENALKIVAPGGLFCLALYNRPYLPGVQVALKRAYNRLPRALRPLLVGAYSAALLSALAAVRGRNPIVYVRDYGRRARGMTFWRDQEDWLGGLPFEYAEESDVRKFAIAHGVRVEHVLVRPPGGNNEYLIRRPEPRGTLKVW